MANTNKVPQKTADGKRNSYRRYYARKKAPKKSAPLPPVEKEKVRISFLGGMNEIGKQVTADDLVVSTMLLDEQSVSAPVFSGLPFLTGIRISQEVDKIVCSL